jgi:predicted RNA-binding Zn-ribbon protein involved in translation (DUF1610 family)
MIYARSIQQEDTDKEQYLGGGERVTKGQCPECGEPMEVRHHRIKCEGKDEVQAKVYVCHKCKGAFVPGSVFGVH